MKTAGYVRISSDQQKDGVSIESQKSKIVAYCEVKDLDLVEIVEDIAISAKNLKGRPGALRLIEMARKGDVQAIVAYKLDRLFRNTVEALETTQQLDKWGVDFHSISESISTKSPMGKFFFTLLAALGQMERELIGERTRAALAHKRLNGQKCGGLTPYGYRAEGGKLMPDDTEQKAIAHMREWRGGQAGVSLAEVCQRLTNAQILTRTGGAWTPETVRRILKRG